MPALIQHYKSKIREEKLYPDECQEAAVQELQGLYDALTFKKTGFFKKKKSPKGLYLWGDVGRGKSMLMDMFYDALPDDMPKRRVHFHAFMIETHDYIHEDRQKKERKKKESESVLLTFAKKVSAETKILCFDEFHVTDIADAMILGRLFTFLFSQGVVVVSTSNWPPDKLYEGGLQRDLFLPFIALLKDRMDAVEVNGAVDYRLQCLSDNGVYFTPLGSTAQKQADHVFARLTEGIKTYEELLTVKGRTIKVSAVANGIARFSFAQLCERPMGAEDYLTIAQNYHSVFLEGVPRLKYDRRNEAKRLMILIDSLYEQRTKLIVTADAAPEALYLGEDHKVEFQRTVSRLIEMQGKAYLGEGS